MKDGFKIVDVDTHMMEPEWLWERYIEDRYKSAAPKMGIAPASGRRTFLVEGESFTREKGKYPMAAPAFLNAVAKAMERFETREFHRLQPAEPPAGHGRAGRRCPDPLSDRRGPDARAPRSATLKLLAACCRAYNDWACEYCSADPQRLHPAAILPMQDVERRCRRRTARPTGRRQLLRAAQSGRRPSTFDDDYLPLWDRGRTDWASRSRRTNRRRRRCPRFGDRMDTHVSGHILSHPFEAMAAMAGLIWYGVFEKFPKLKVVHVEADGGWVPYWLQRMEQHWDFSGNAEHEYLTKPPDRVLQAQHLRRLSRRRADDEGRGRTGRRRQLSVGHRLPASRRNLSVGNRRDDASSRSSDEQAQDPVGQPVRAFNLN